MTCSYTPEYADTIARLQAAARGAHLPPVSGEGADAADDEEAEPEGPEAAYQRELAAEVILALLCLLSLYSRPAASWPILRAKRAGVDGSVGYMALIGVISRGLR